MKKIFILSIGLTLLVCKVFSRAPSNEADKIVGMYWSPKKDAKLEIYKKGNHFFGRSVWVATPRKDSKNPNTSLQNRDLLGIELLNGFSFDDGSYSGGEIYDPESGKTYDCKITRDGENLKVRGYIGISLFGRTEIFEHIKSF